MPRFLTADRTVILRTARKTWRCLTHKRHELKPRAEARICPLADGLIRPGDTYIEYVGEVPAYQSGSSYCEACGRALFAEDIAAEETRERWHAFEAEQRAKETPSEKAARKHPAKPARFTKEELAFLADDEKRLNRALRGGK